MDIMNPTAVIGTNAWGSKLYSKGIRGSYVPDEILIDAMRESREQDIPFYDLAALFFGMIFFSKAIHSFL